MRTFLIALLGLVVVCHNAAAQGNGHGNAYGHYKSTVSSACRRYRATNVTGASTSDPQRSCRATRQD